MATGPRPYRVLILAAQPAEAEGLLRGLHTARLLVRGMFSQHPPKLPQLLAEHPCDLLLVRLSEAITADAVADGLRSLKQPPPLLVVHPPATDAAALLSLLADHLAAAVPDADPTRLAAAAKRLLAVGALNQRVAEVGERQSAARRNLDEVIAAASDAIVRLCADRIAACNPAFQRLFDYVPGDSSLEPPFSELVTPEHRGIVQNLLGAGRLVEAEALASHPIGFIDGLGRRIERRVRLVMEDDDCRLLILLPLGDEPTRATAASDPETGALDRSALRQRLADLLSERNALARSFALVLVLLDDYAQVRRDGGLDGALHLVTRAAAALRQIAPEGGVLGRVADDAFALLVEDTSDGELRALGDRLRTALNALPAGDMPACSLGIVVAEPGSASPPELLDRALTEAQAQHTGATAAPPEPTLPVDALPLEGRIERALDEDAFKIMFQPIISLMGDSQENYSVLLRLEDINHLMLTATDLLEPAARSGNLPEIDRRVIGLALRELTRRRKAGQRIGFFVSLSGETVRDEGLLIWICDAMREHDARGGWLTFQLQERDARGQLEAWGRLAEGLRKIKCRVAINQFGHDPRPEQLLDAVPADFVKFAPELAIGLAEDPSRQKRLGELAAVARQRGARTIVTGVEDARSLTVLWSSGIDYVQGNFLQPPSSSLDAPN